MEQFSLEKWLKDKSRKVVTRDGREVDLFYSPTSKITLIGRISDTEIHQYTKDGFQCDTMNQAKNDLFFADEEDELTEFEKAISEFIQKLTFNGNVLPSKDIKGYAKSLLELARKELLKDLPKWEYCGDNDSSFHTAKDGNGHWMLFSGGYRIMLYDVLRLPKEE